jgi:hypothetical protein
VELAEGITYFSNEQSEL